MTVNTEANHCEEAYDCMYGSELSGKNLWLTERCSATPEPQGGTQPQVRVHCPSQLALKF